VQNFLKIGSGVPELEDPEKWHFPMKAFIALTTVLPYRADCNISLRPTRGFRGRAIERRQWNFFRFCHDWHWLPWQL